MLPAAQVLQQSVAAASWTRASDLTQASAVLGARKRGGQIVRLKEDHRLEQLAVRSIPELRSFRLHFHAVEVHRAHEAGSLCNNDPSWSWELLVASSGER